MAGFRGAGWYRKRAVNVGSGAVGAVRGGLVTKVSGMEGGLSMVAEAWEHQEAVSGALVLQEHGRAGYWCLTSPPRVPTLY